MLLDLHTYLNVDHGAMYTKPPITVIGLGLMGRALARAFLRAGHPTTVWNCTASTATELVAEGAQLAPTVTEALSASPLIVSCVTDYRVLREVLDPAAEGLAGRLLVNLTSGDSTQARAMAQWAERLRASYLDGAVMAIPPAIGSADAVILLSGRQTDVEMHRALLEALGTATYLGEDHGLSGLYDVAGLSMMWSVLNGWLHGVAMVRTAGVDASTFTPFAHQMAVGTADWLAGYAEQIDAGSYPADDATLDTHAGGMAHLIEERERLGVNAELPRVFKALADRAVAAGRGAQSFPVLVEEYGKRSG